jgi:hypothetical protein
LREDAVPVSAHRAVHGNVFCDDPSVPDDSEDLLCQRCGVPVLVNRIHYETFERMHYTCFHYELEHTLPDGSRDPDGYCGVVGCPSGAA